MPRRSHTHYPKYAPTATFHSPKCCFRPQGRHHFFYNNSSISQEHLCTLAEHQNYYRWAQNCKLLQKRIFQIVSKNLCDIEFFEKNTKKHENFEDFFFLSKKFFKMKICNFSISVRKRLRHVMAWFWVPLGATDACLRSSNGSNNENEKKHHFERVSKILPTSGTQIYFSGDFFPNALGKKFLNCLQIFCCDFKRASSHIFATPKSSFSILQTGYKCTWLRNRR